jgi:hypothetical protein
MGGLDGRQRAGVADYAAACDHATGTTAMSTLVDRHFSKAEPVDLLPWQELGVSMVSNASRSTIAPFSALAQCRAGIQPSG